MADPSKTKLLAFVEQIAYFQIDGDIVEGEEVEMSNDDAWETVMRITQDARSMLGLPPTLDDDEE